MRILAIAVLCLVPGFAPAQPIEGESLSDIRTDLTALEGMITGLRQELQGGAGQVNAGIVNAAPILERIQLLESEVTRVTGEVEKLRARVEKVVSDGTNRLDDLKYRVTELEGGDIGNIPATPPLGTQSGGTAQPPATAGGTASTDVPITGAVRPRLRDGTPTAGLAEGFANGTTTLDPVTSAPVTTDPSTTLPPVPDLSGGTDTARPELALAEQETFDRAKAAFDAGNDAQATLLFNEYLLTYPGGALSDEAQFLRGEAFARSGDWQNATRAYLDTFSGQPEGPRAPEALYKVGRSLGMLGRVPEACQTLQEVLNRYPAASPAILQQVQTEQQTLSCL
ncbi:tol-pal system protein YbgF [Algicella marina]|nr:tol-pal system protein YbgF [Algicella marina]